jgi:hypothetical protein
MLLPSYKEKMILNFMDALTELYNVDKTIDGSSRPPIGAGRLLQDRGSYVSLSDSADLDRFYFHLPCRPYDLLNLKGSNLNYPSLS